MRSGGKRSDALSQGRALQQVSCLVFKLAQPRQLLGLQPAVLLAQPLERGIADAELAADLIDFGAQLRLIKRKCDLP